MDNNPKNPPPPPAPPSETSSVSPAGRSGASSPAQRSGARASEGPHKPRHLWTWIVVIVLLLLCFIVYRMWSAHVAKEKAAEAAKRAAQQGTPITTATAAQGNIGVYLDAIGTVTPVYTASITSQVNGQITDVYYKEGQLVKKGDPLIDIDSRSYRATLLQAQGMLEKDQNVLAQAELDLDRYKAALARNAIAEQIEADQEKLVAQDKGVVKNDEGTVQFDQVQVDYCHITSPITGRVGLRLVDPGNVVQSSGTLTLAVVAQVQPITIVFTIAEDSLAPVQARLRQHAVLSVDAYDRSAQTKITSGHLIAVDNQIDTTTGTVKGRAQFDNKNNELFPNEFVNTRLLVNTLMGVTLVPASAVQQNGSSSFVYVIQQNFAHLKTVKPGVTDAGNTQVEGINPGDIVANSGFDKLQDNARVSVDNGNNNGQQGGQNTPGNNGNNQNSKKGGHKNGGKSQ
jgi:multidrug efflux system membrane fusion protein